MFPTIIVIIIIIIVTQQQRTRLVSSPSPYDSPSSKLIRSLSFLHSALPELSISLSLSLFLLLLTRGYLYPSPSSSSESASLFYRKLFLVLYKSIPSNRVAIDSCSNNTFTCVSLIFQTRIHSK